MEYRIGLIHGDGIGPEIVKEAKKVLDAVCEKYGHKFEYTNLLLGGARTFKNPEIVRPVCKPASGLPVSGIERCLPVKRRDHRRGLRHADYA